MGSPGRGRPFAALLLVIVMMTPGVARADYRLVELGGRAVKWGAPRFGVPATVTYGFVAGPRHFAGARNCEDMTAIEPEKLGAGVTAKGFGEVVSKAFARWSQAAGITFRPAGPGEHPGILLGVQAHPTGRAYTNVTPGSGDGLFAEASASAARGLDGGQETTAAPQTRTSPMAIGQALICLNPLRGWKIGLDGNRDVYDLEFTLAHEIGHAIGLDHPSDRNELMHFRYREVPTRLSAGDIAGARLLYGPPLALARGHHGP
ncbi:MAG: matrixin family metalloprotease [Hyphomicrobiaceae bacterium]